MLTSTCYFGRPSSGLNGDVVAQTSELQPFREAIVCTYPELSAAQFRLQNTGWDSIAVEVDDRLIFRFPRHETAKKALERETSLLRVIRPAVTMRVPEPVLHAGPPFFSCHVKIEGEHLVPDVYAGLSDSDRETLAADLAQFYAELHALNAEQMRAAGAGPIRAWVEPEEMLRRIWPILPAEYRTEIERTVMSWQELPPDPHGETYGFFDGHGWNMAFDRARNKLNGIYDFGDSGFGSLHQEFIYSNFISRDLTIRICRAYERLTNRNLDRERIELMSTVLRISELAELHDDPRHGKNMLGYLLGWLESRNSI